MGQSGRSPAGRSTISAVFTKPTRYVSTQDICSKRPRPRIHCNYIANNNIVAVEYRVYFDVSKWFTEIITGTGLFNKPSTRNFIKLFDIISSLLTYRNYMQVIPWKLFKSSVIVISWLIYIVFFYHKPKSIV